MAKARKVYRPATPPGDGIPHAVCGAKKKNGEGICKKPAGSGTNHSGVGLCSLHGGNLKGHEKAVAVTIGNALVPERPVMGLPVRVDPARALAKLVDIAAGEVVYATTKIAELNPGDERFRAVNEKGEPIGIEKIHPWISMRHRCMDRLANFAAMAIRSDVAERNTVVRETFAAIAATYTKALIAELRLTPEQVALVPGAMKSALLVAPADEMGEILEEPY